MTLNDRIIRFIASRSKADLEDIKRKHGKFGISLACDEAGITRRAGRQILGIAEHDYQPHQLASRLGYSTFKPNFHGKEIKYDGKKSIAR